MDRWVEWMDRENSELFYHMIYTCIQASILFVCTCLPCRGITKKRIDDNDDDDDFVIVMVMTMLMILES